MNIPMSEEMRAKLISETNSMQEEAEQSNNKIARIIKATKHETITISGLGFELEVYTSVPGPLKKEFIKLSKLSNKEGVDIEELNENEIELEAKLVAAMCADPDLKHKELWIEFENQTGLLRSLAETIIEETCGTEKEVKHFRRMP